MPWLVWFLSVCINFLHIFTWLSASIVPTKLNLDSGLTVKELQESTGGLTCESWKPLDQPLVNQLPFRLGMAGRHHRSNIIPYKHAAGGTGTSSIVQCASRRPRLE